MFEKSKNIVKDIVACIKKREERDVQSTPPVLGAVLTNVFYKGIISRVHDMAKNYWVEESCNACGICTFSLLFLPA